MQFYKHKKTGRVFEPFIKLGTVSYFAQGTNKAFPNGPELIPDWMIIDSQDWEPVSLVKCGYCDKIGFQSGGLHFKIASFRDKPTGTIIPRREENVYSASTSNQSFRGTAESFLKATEDRYEIHSVLRTCDRVIFKVGNHVMVRGELEKITAFSIKDGQCLITLENESARQVSILDPTVFKAVVLDLANPSPSFLQEVFEGLGF